MAFNVTTFLFELVNFLVLLFLLQRIVFKPLRASIDQRRSALSAREERARVQAEEAEATRAEFERRTQELSGMRERLAREGAADAAEARARILTEAREDAAAERARAEHLLEEERGAALAWARETVVERSTELAGRLLLQMAPQAVDSALLTQLLLAIDREAAGFSSELGTEHLPEARPEIEVTSAHRLTEEEIDSLRACLDRSLGLAPRLTLREDESLVAGLIVRVGHRVLDASLEGHLQALRSRTRELLETGAGLA